MTTVFSSVWVAAPVPVVFAYVDDTTQAPSYVEGLVTFTPLRAGDRRHQGSPYPGPFGAEPADRPRQRLDSQAVGPGSRFEAGMVAGGSMRTCILEMTRRLKDAEIEWAVAGGARQRGRFVFTAEDGGTRVTFTVAAEIPGGVAGRLLAKTLEGTVRGLIERSLTQLAAELEALPVDRQRASF